MQDQASGKHKNSYLYWLSNFLIVLGVLILVGMGALLGKAYYDKWQIEQPDAAWQQQKQQVLQNVPFATSVPPATAVSDTPTPEPTYVNQSAIIGGMYAGPENAVRDIHSLVSNVPTPTPTPTPTPVPYRFPVPTRMVIPRIDVDSPIVEKGLKREVVNGVEMWIPETAKDAVAHYYWTAHPGEGGNAVFAGHISSRSEGNVFTHLDQLRPGDDVIIYAGDKAVLYKVVDRKIVPPDDVHVMDPTKDAVATLITCYPDWVYSDRLVVTARLVGPAP